MVICCKSYDYIVSFNAGCINELDPKITGNLSVNETREVEKKIIQAPIVKTQ